MTVTDESANENCGPVTTIGGLKVAPYAAPPASSQLNCQAVVVRMGEIFGEFAIDFDNTIMAHEMEGVTEWQLYVYGTKTSRRPAGGVVEPLLTTEDGLPDLSGDPTGTSDAECVVCCDILDLKKPRKIVKLQAGHHYIVLVRCFNSKVAVWSPWSPPAYTATLHPVLAHIEDIGEDYVRIHWDRAAVRETMNLTPEVDAAATKRVENIANLEMRVVRERDMRQEFSDRFESGIRAYTLHSLQPGTAYIVMIRYETLIGTQLNWTEVSRFYTETALMVELNTRGEDAISVHWQRKAPPTDVVGYALPHTVPHLFEVNVESDGMHFPPVELSAKEHAYRFTGLFPSSTYAISVRSISAEGRWGARSNELTVCTADTPTISSVALGETFLSFTWSRPNEEAPESKVEYLLQCSATQYRQTEVVELKRLEDGSMEKVFHVESLKAGTEYAVSIRTFLDQEWGCWTEPRHFTTLPKAALTFLERGEDFFTLHWPDTGVAQAESEVRSVFNIVVNKVEYSGERVRVLDERITPSSDQPGFRVSHLQADTEYEVQSRTWQRNKVTGFEGWGEFSYPVHVKTLQPVVLNVLDLGEDFAHIIWRRGLCEDRGAGDDGPEWEFLKYEIVVGCMDTGEDAVLHRQVVETDYSITNLHPSTTYIVSVRACDNRDQWGLWSKIKVRTLASVETAVHEIGEDFVRLMWQRKAVDTNSTDVTAADMFISKYSIFVYSKELLEKDVLPHNVSGYGAGGKSDVARHHIVTSDHTSFCVTDLLPDREFVAVVRASTASGKWGLWSKPIHFRTNPQFCIPVNNLSIGENYVNLIWSRDTEPVTDPGVLLGDLTVTGQQLRIHGVNTQYSKDHTLDADIRELKIYGLSPATAYTIQLRVCGKSGCWGLWSPPVHILTRGTILTKTVEVAEDYATIAWERRKVPNPHHYPTGRGVVTSYHLRVYNNVGVHLETFLGDADCPYRITGMKPDTYYCVELKANYNDEEWGLWSTPLWCLTMQPMRIEAKLISEEFCCLSISRPTQQRRLPEDDGNRTTEDKMVAFGHLRSHLMLCVTTPVLSKAPHTVSGYVKAKSHDSSLPPDAIDHRLAYQTEISSLTEATEHTVPNLKSNTVYSVSVRSKLPNGDWGMWAPSMLFATVPTTCVQFNDIGEHFIRVEWKRHTQLLPPQITDPDSVILGLGMISASRVRIREVGGSYQHLYSIDSSVKALRLEDLSPATTYGVSVQTYNDNFDWGAWSEESKVRTAPGMDINIQHLTEDAMWVSWTRLRDLDNISDPDTAMNVNIAAKSYEVSITGPGLFRYTKEMNSNKLFFRGLMPDTVYQVHVRALFAETEEWGLWSTKSFRTKPRLRVTFGSIGEHFAIVEWRRHLPHKLGEDDLQVKGPITECEDFVQQFRFKVQLVGNPVPKIYDLSPTVSSFRLKNLQPASEYRVWMCAKGYEGVWGLWNEEVRVRTLPKLKLEILDIGEDYVRVSWKRGPWDGECMPDNDAEVRQVDGAVSGYEIRVLDRNGETVSTQYTGSKETYCVLAGLDLLSLYSVEVRAKDTYDEWGLWSDPRRFVTLHAVETNLLRFGEAFVDVEWARSDVLRQRFYEQERIEELEEDEDVEEGEVSEAEVEGQSEVSFSSSAASEESFPDDVMREDETVLEWHVRVQCLRLYGGVPDVEDFKEFYCTDEDWRRIEGLLPNTTYVVTVRARNRAGDWGHWSPSLTVHTYPLVEVDVECVGETFANVSWVRPDRSEEAAVDDELVCFPAKVEIHNYQVTVKPLSTELPFDEEDEPLVEGARVYETTQPSLRLGNLLPGTRYIATVREQQIDDDGKAIPGVWGAHSDCNYLETVPPLRILPLEIGEDYCLVEWKRTERVPEEDNLLFAISTSRWQQVTDFEIHVLRLTDDAVTTYEGPMALDTMVPLPPNKQKHHIEELLHNTIYAVRVRSKGEMGTWGPWSPVTKFVTQCRLLLQVQDVFETDFVVSWTRPRPKWYDELQCAGETADENAEVEPSPLCEVLLGDYSIEKYELVIKGMCCEPSRMLNRCLTLDNDVMEVSIADLQQNQLYSVCVRSLSQNHHWSRFSNKEAVLTLAPMEVHIAHYTENAAVVRWYRNPSDVSQFAELMDRDRVEAERQCDERERRDLFELKCRLQEMESLGEKVSGWLDPETRRELNALIREETIHHLILDNVVCGNTDNTGFHLQIFSECTEGCHCCPYVRGVEKMRLVQGPKKKAEAPPKRTGVKKRGGDYGASTANLLDASSIPPLPGDAGVTLNNLALEESAVLEEGTLIDVQLLETVQEVVVMNLKPSSVFHTSVRSRSTREEWQPWSARAPIATLAPITLGQSRFGEHYINLFWHRMNEEATQDMDRNIDRCQELNEEFKHYAPDDLRKRQQELPAEEFNSLLERLKELRRLRRQVAAQKQELADGKVDLIIDPNTPIRGFQLRIVLETGEFTEYYLDNLESIAAFTATGLAPNHMYVCLLCADYGNNIWGQWTKPLKFMTQNLIQLQLTYTGESFVDIEWQRMDNKKLPPIDRDDTITSDPLSEEEQIYQVRIVHEDIHTSEEIEEYRDMKACNVFRIDHLEPDTKYTIAVREWDAKGDWGLWCAPRTCCTIPGLYTVHDDIGENWAVVSWGRKEKRVDYDNDMHVLQFGVETLSYYLRVIEIAEKEEEEDEVVEESNEDEEAGHQQSSLETEEDRLEATLKDIEGFLAPSRQRVGPLPPHEHPKEFEGEVHGLYHLVKHFEDASVTTFTIENLKPDHFYCVQVLSETTGGQLGIWSAEQFMLTTSKIQITTECIDELYIDIQWCRYPPRQHPKLPEELVYVGNYEAVTYELDATGPNYALNTILPAGVTSYHVKDLMMDTVYNMRVRSVNTKEQISLWSDALCAVTLKPLVVWPLQITENAISLEWGRGEQLPENYPEGETPLQIGSRTSAGYHLKAFRVCEEGLTPLFEKNFNGEVTQMEITSLAANTAYVMAARASNDRDEWGLWSEDRCVYTMKLIQTVVAAVGEDFVRILWNREAPDEIQPPNTPDAAQPSSSEEAQTPSEALAPRPKKKRFPLLDRPVDQQPIYLSAHSTVKHFAISVRREEEPEGYTLEAKATAHSFTVPALRPDAVYYLSVRACYGNGEWGPWSETVQTGTYNLLAVELKDLGEDFFAAAWQRQANTANLHQLLLGKVEETMCYELAVHDFTDVPFGEEGVAELDSRALRSLFIQPKQRNCTVRDLLSNHRYRISVRRWYQPLEKFLEDCPPVNPSTDDSQTRDMIERTHAVPGAWSEPDFAVTLRDMYCAMEKIGEDFFCVRWERDPRAPSLPVRKSFAPRPITNYQIRIDELVYDGTAIESGGDSFHVNELIAPTESQFLATSLKPDCAYRVEVRCCIEKVWGRWSKPVYILTLPKLQIEVTDIGEDTASVAWSRHFRGLQMPDGIDAVIGDSDNHDKYQLEINGLGISFQLNKRFKGTRTSYTAKHLEANSLYSIRVRSNDDIRQCWSLWSEVVHFATLQPLRLKVGSPAEQFVYVDWYREAQQPEDYRELLPEGNIVVGDPDVVAYHLCVFSTQETPSLAVLDKQFHKDICRYRISTLTPDNSYVVIVRACNANSQWGLWSEEKNFRTRRLLELQLQMAGETYANLQWERTEEDLSDANAQISNYVLVLRSDDVTTERTFLPSECGVSPDEFKLSTFHVDQLNPGKEYVMALQSCYLEGDWGMWSKPITFSTLNPLEMSIAATRGNLELQWGRKPKPAHVTIVTPAPPPAVPEVPTVPKSSVTKYQLLACRQSERAIVFGEAVPEEEEGTGPTRELIPDRDEPLPVEGSTADIPDMDQEENLEGAPKLVELFKYEKELSGAEADENETHLVMEHLDMDTVYVVRVRAMDENKEWGDWTESIVETPPSAPTGVVLRRVNAQYCSLQWTPPGDPKNNYRYVIEQYMANEGPSGRSSKAAAAANPHDWRVVDTIDNDTVCPIPIVGQPNRMRCRIKCARKGDHPSSEFSDPVGLSSGTPPEPVSELMVTALSRNSATLEWAPPPKPANGTRYSRPLFRVYLTEKDRPALLVTTAHRPTYTITDLTSATEYTVQIVAENQDGVSYQNPSIRFNTKHEIDQTTVHFEEGMQPLGRIVDPVAEARAREAALKEMEIPVAKSLKGKKKHGEVLTPQPPKGPAPGRSGRQGSAAMGSAAEGGATAARDSGRKSGRSSSKRKGSKGKKNSKSKGKSVTLPPI